MTYPLWRQSPRASTFASLAEQFTRSTGTDAETSVASDLFFGPDATPNFQGAFSITGASSLTFSSQALVGPPPGVLPTSWFKLDTQRVVLAEMDYVDQIGSGLSAAPTTKTLYFADAAYFDDENGRVYQDRIKAVPRYNRSIDRSTLRGRWTNSIGSLDLFNSDGQLDVLLKYACDGAEIRFYIGDGGDVARGIAPWKRSEFIFVFSARVAKVTAPTWNGISVALKSTDLFLKKKIGGSVPVGGSGPAADSFRPWNFGYVRQIECIQSDATTLTYDWNEDGENATLLVVRDKGASVGFTDNGDGTFQLLSPPNGAITAEGLVDRGLPSVDVTGSYPNSNGSYRLSDAFYQAAGIECGLVASGLYAGPAANFRANGVSDYYVGINVKEARDGVDVLNDLCDTGNCYYTVRRDGQFVFSLLRPEAVDFQLDVSNAFTVGTDDIVGSIRIDHADPSFSEVQGIANINWTTQTEFAGELTEEPETLAHLQRDGYRTPTYGAHVAGEEAYLGPDETPDGAFTWVGGAPELYHQTLTRSVDNKTLISSPVDDPDATRALSDWEGLRRAQFLPWLELIDFEVDLSYFQVEIGDVVTLDLTDNDPTSTTFGQARFDIAGVNYQVVTVDIALTENRIALGLVRRRPAVTDHWTL